MIPEWMIWILWGLVILNILEIVFRIDKSGKGKHQIISTPGTNAIATLQAIFLVMLILAIGG